MTTGEKIAEGRKKLNLTQQQFADSLGVSRQAVSRWESDLAFPETEMLIKLSQTFGCTVDYLLKYDAQQGAEEKSEPAAAPGKIVLDFNRLRFEYKSKTTLFGLPLVHINFGVFAVAKGIIAIGPVAVGLLSIGVFGVGLLTLSCFALGLVALGAIAAGGIALGGVAAGFIALGGLAFGVYSLGGCSIGLFALGGYANGRLVAVGDYAVGQIAFGKTVASGSRISVTSLTFAELKEEAFKLIDELPPIWNGFKESCKHIAEIMLKS